MSSGHQHHHGVKKNIVEGIGGLIIGAAAVLLITRWFKGRQSGVARAEPLPEPGPTTKAPVAKAAARRAPVRKAPVAPEAAAPVSKAPAKRARPSRAKAKPAAEPDA